VSGPTITNRNPDPSIPVGPTDPISFDVILGTNPLLDVIVAATMAGTNLYEVIYDGSAFAPLYASLSSAQAIAGGVRFRVRRIGGWLGAPTLLTKAIDTAGNEAT
jgi:hypothetical protein